MINLQRHVEFAIMDLDEVRDRWPFQFDEQTDEIEIHYADGGTKWVRAHKGPYFVGYRGGTLLVLVSSAWDRAEAMVRDTLPV